jgi:hypothetical protein
MVEDDEDAYFILMLARYSSLLIVEKSIFWRPLGATAKVRIVL